MMAKSNGHLTQRAYARLKGVTPQYISSLVRRGVLPVGEGGKLNPSDCDRAMETIRPRMRPHAGPKPTSSERQSYLQSRAVSEHFRARLLRLEFERASGKLLDADTMLDKLTVAFSNVRVRLGALPRSLAPVLVNQPLTGTVERILSQAIDNALLVLSTDIFATSDAGGSG
jgi:hypothetical protein